MKGKETMTLENSETTGRTGKPTPPGPAPEPEIDLERLIWDPEYRDRMRRRLKRSG
jgi:hypothetical protein